MFVSNLKSRQARESVRNLLGKGLSDYEISRRTGVGRSTVQSWRRRGFPAPTAPAPIRPERWGVEARIRYAYLLGIYLGDGTVTRHGGSYGLHLYLDLTHPGIIEECASTVEALSGSEPGRWVRPGTNCMRLTSYGHQWPELLPQTGPGRKHHREIKLETWQQAIVDEFPEPFIRGLIHSDGSGCMNSFVVELKDGPKRYTYPRYFFTNYSADIRAIFCEACDRIGIRWSRSSWTNISVSHRDSVARLDRFVGPKA
jgi:hypothetical protein